MTKIDYSQLSDFEINKRVSVAAGLNVNMFFDVDEEYVRGPVWTAPSGNCYAGIKSSKGNPFDPCHNPADAWPIIVEHRINIEWHEWKNGIFRPYALNNETMKSCYDTNPLRAAMIVFLEMQ